MILFTWFWFRIRTYLVTDPDIDPETLTRLQEMGIQVIVAEVDPRDANGRLISGRR